MLLATALAVRLVGRGLRKGGSSSQARKPCGVPGPKFQIALRLLGGVVPSMEDALLLLALPCQVAEEAREVEPADAEVARLRQELAAAKKAAAAAAARALPLAAPRVDAGTCTEEPQQPVMEQLAALQKELEQVSTVWEREVNWMAGRRLEAASTPMHCRVWPGMSRHIAPPPRLQACGERDAALAKLEALAAPDSRGSTSEEEEESSDGSTNGDALPGVMIDGFGVWPRPMRGGNNNYMQWRRHCRQVSAMLFRLLHRNTSETRVAVDTLAPLEGQSRQGMQGLQAAGCLMCLAGAGVCLPTAI